MICYFCNSALRDTAPAGSLKEIFLFYVCPGCQPHEVIYRELYDQDTDELIADAIRIDEYLIIRNYQTNTTEFDRTIRDNKFTNVNNLFKMDGIWNISSTDIKSIKQKLNLYTTFS